MAGFRKDTAVTIIRVPMSFQHQIKNADTGETTIEDADVAHNFKIPTIKARERYQRELATVKRGRVKTFLFNANWNLFQQVIQSVEGYDDLPKPEEQTHDALIQYFSDDVGRLHVDEAILRLIESISAQDSDWEKK